MAESERGLARDSVSIAGWTAVSRVSGFVRIAVVAAVLGPTFLGNVFQATSSFPALAYAALTGSLFASLLVPGLVRRIDAADPQGADRLAGSFLAVALLGFGLAAGLVLLGSHWVLRLLAVGAPDPAVADAQQRAGLVLLALFLPQLVLYAVVGTSEAVMNSRGEFAWPNAVPLVENLGIVATMLVTARVFGSGEALASPSATVLLVLGLGTTASVAAHAAMQWWGARRVGVVLLPRFRWRDPELRRIFRRGGHSLGYTTLDVLLPFSGVVVANRIAGGVVAFQFAFLCCGLPMMLLARPVGVALLPGLSRRFQAGDLRGFRDELVRGLSLVAFLAVPATLALVLLAGPIADAMTFGEMATPHGRQLVAVAVGSLGFAVLGAVGMTVGTYALYARGDARTPFVAAVLRAVVVVAGVVVGLNVAAGVLPLLVVGLTISLAELVGGGWMAFRLRSGLPSGGPSLVRPVLRAFAVAVLAIAPALVLARVLPSHLPERGNAQATMLIIILVVAATYLGLQQRLGSPELALLTGRLRDPAGGPHEHPAPAPDAAPLDPAPLDPVPLDPARLDPARLDPAPLDPARLDPVPLDAAAGPAGAHRTRRPRPIAWPVAWRLAWPGAWRVAWPVALVAAVAVAACVLGPLATTAPPTLVAAGFVGVLLVAAAYWRPPLAAYLLLAGTPLLAGVARNGVLPLLRPHEALGLLLGAGVALRALVQVWSGHPLPLRFSRLDLVLALMAAAGSVLPLLWMLARGQTPTAEDLQYAAALWKFYALFLLVRATIRTERQVNRALAVCLAAGVVVAAFAMAEGLVPAVADLGDALFPGDVGSGPSEGRGAASLGSTIAVGDVMAFDLAICLAWMFVARGRHPIAGVLAVVFVLGALASGQFSGVLAVVIVVLAVAVLTGRVLRLLAVMTPVAALAAVALRPVIMGRLADVDVSTGLPQSWGVRLENLELYIWPRLFTGWDWLLGVRPTTVVEVSTPYAPQVYIESGYTWLLWTGGVPLVLAFLAFTAVALHQSALVARRAPGAYAVAGAAAFCAVLVTALLMAFDPHLTTRGTADLLFSLLGLAAAGAAAVARTTPVQVPDPRLPVRRAGVPSVRVPVPAEVT